MGEYYPVFLDLRGKKVLVVGAGKVALRKVRGLIEAGARVSVVAPEVQPAFDTLPVKIVRRRFRRSDVRGQALVFAATNDRRVNHAVAETAKGAGILANIADAPEECDFIVPARARRGPLQIAVSTGARSPRLAAELRRRIEEILESAHL